MIAATLERLTAWLAYSDTRWCWRDGLILLAAFGLGFLLLPAVTDVLVSGLTLFAMMITGLAALSLLEWAALRVLRWVSRDRVFRAPEGWGSDDQLGGHGE